MLILIRKPGRVGEHCVGTAKLGSPGIHHGNKVFNGSADMLCNLKSDIIGRGNHDGVQALFHGKNFVQLCGNVGSSISNTGNAGSCHGYFICKITVL